MAMKMRTPSAEWTGIGPGDGDRLTASVALPTTAANPPPRPGEGGRRTSQTRRTAAVFQALMVLALVLAAIAIVRHPSGEQATVDPSSPHAPPPAVLVQPDG